MWTEEITYLVKKFVYGYHDTSIKKLVIYAPHRTYIFKKDKNAKGIIDVHFTENGIAIIWEIEADKTLYKLTTWWIRYNEVRESYV